MKRNVHWIATGIIGPMVLTSGILLAQKGGVHPDTRVMGPEFGDRSFMGVRLGDVTAEDARELKLAGDSGAVVKEVEKDGPAAKAGVQKNDVIVEFDGERVRSVAELRRLVRETPPERTVKLQVSRQGQVHNLNITLASRHALLGDHGIRIPEIHLPPVNIPFNFNFSWGAGRLGISAQELTSQLATYFGVNQGKGVLVMEVKKDSPADRAGLKAGDCIVKVDSKEVTSVWDLRNALNQDSWEKPEKRQHVLTIVRDRHEQTIAVEIEPAHWPGSSESTGVLAPEPPESFEPAEPLAPEELIAPELNGLGQEIEGLKARAGQAKAEARIVEEQVQRELQSADMQKQLAELRQQFRAVSKDQVMRQLEQMKRQMLDEAKQKELRRQYEELLRKMMHHRDTV
jgi:serine protease Do